MTVGVLRRPSTLYLCLPALIAVGLTSATAGDSATGWLPVAPAEVDLDAAGLESATAALSGRRGVQCVAVARGGRLVAEAPAGDACRRPHNIQSASKSILSLLVGIAVEQKLVALDSTLADLLPLQVEGLETTKRQITLENLLVMQSGLASTSGDAYGAWVSTDDWARAALARPLTDPPGTRFKYSTGNTHLLAAILRRAVDRELLSWGNEVLFQPLGVSVDGWDRSPEGVRFGGNSFAVTPLELLTLGQLVLDDGRRGDRQLVPADWLARSFAVHSEGWPDRYGAYGYLWWLRPESGAVLAVGYGGQFLYLVPELDLAVVVTSDHRGKGAEWDRRVLDDIESGIVAAAR